MQINRIYWSERDQRLVGKRAELTHRPAEIPHAPSIHSASDVSSRTWRFVLSSDRVDRSGDVINQSGWDLSEFKKNSVALFAHNSVLLAAPLDCSNASGLQPIGQSETSSNW